MTKGIPSVIETIRMDGSHLHILVNRRRLSPKELTRLNTWLRHEGYLSKVKYVNVGYYEKDQTKKFTERTLTIKVVLLLAYFVLWPVISLIVAFLLFSR